MSQTLTVYAAGDWYDANGYPADLAAMDAYFDTANVTLFDSVSLLQPPMQVWPDTMGPLGSSVKFAAQMMFELAVVDAGEYAFAVDGDAVCDLYIDDEPLYDDYTPSSFTGDLDNQSGIVTLPTGTYTLRVRVVNGVTMSGYSVWCKLPGSTSWELLPLELYTNLAPLAGVASTSGVAMIDTYPDRPHRLAGVTRLSGQPVPRRVEVCGRQGDYVASTVSVDDGSFEFNHLPAQSLADPYTVTCYDRPDEHGNALIFDRVYQLDDNGDPPQT